MCVLMVKYLALSSLLSSCILPSPDEKHIDSVTLVGKEIET